MSVTQKVTAGLAILAAILAVAIGVTAWLTSWNLAAAIWIGALVLLVAAALLLPVRTGDLLPHPTPCDSFEAARDRIETEVAETAGRLNPLCPPRLLHHGTRTRTAVVLLHGISSCPQAFVDFAPLLHARGHNVLVGRMPCNGLKDRATDALNDLTARKLARWGDRVVDQATGLGDEIVVCGISAGGTVAAWIGQNRPEVARAVLIAPFLGLAGVGLRLNLLVMRLLLVLPPLSVWKDPVKREKYEGMPHAYKRQSTRGTGEVMRLGYAAARQAGTTPPAAASAVLVTNENDAAISNDVAERFAALWDAAGRDVVRYVFPRKFGLGHEIIDPMEPGANPAVTYPVLIDLIEGRAVHPTEPSTTSDGRS